VLNIQKNLSNGIRILRRMTKVNHVIRENENESEDNDSPYVKLNSNFAFANIAININRFQKS
jgi:hypothetical protein